MRRYFISFYKNTINCLAGKLKQMLPVFDFKKTKNDKPVLFPIVVNRGQTGFGISARSV